MTDIPDWIDDKLEVRPRAEVQDEAIVEYFLTSTAPYHSRNQIQNEFGWSKQNANDRLGDLVELRVLNSDRVADGTIYWIDRDESEWPIPPDVEVEPIEEESIFDDLTQNMKFIGVVSVLSMLLGGLLVSIAPFLEVLGLFAVLGVTNGVGLLFVIGWLALTLGFIIAVPPVFQLISSQFN